LKTVHCIRT